MDYYFPFGYPPGYSPQEELPSNAHVHLFQEPPRSSPQSRKNIKSIRITSVDGHDGQGKDVRALQGKINYLENKNLGLENKNLGLENRNRFLDEQLRATQRMLKKTEEGKKVLEVYLARLKKLGGSCGGDETTLSSTGDDEKGAVVGGKVVETKRRKLGRDDDDDDEGVVVTDNKTVEPESKKRNVDGE